MVESEDVRDVAIWASPPDAQLPRRSKEVRFAIGVPHDASTHSWKAVASKRDAYVICRDSFRDYKLSLHASGKWRFGFDERAIRHRPDLLPGGRDRALRKISTRELKEFGFQEAFQIIALRESLVLQPEHRTKWKSSTIFVEPSTRRSDVTLVSVVVAGIDYGIVLDPPCYTFAIMPLDGGRTVHLIARHEASADDFKNLIIERFNRALRQKGNRGFPSVGSLFMHGQ